MVMGVNTPNITCPLCNKENESNDLLITCEYTRGIQDQILKWCGIQKRRFLNVKESIDYATIWGNCLTKKKNSKLGVLLSHVEYLVGKE